MPIEPIEIEPLQRTWAVPDVQELEAFEAVEVVVSAIASSLVAAVAWGSSCWERGLHVVQELLPVELDWSFLWPWYCQRPSIPCRLHV